MAPDQLADEVNRLLDSSDPSHAKLLEALDRILHHFQCVVGTVHRTAAPDLLELWVHRGLPPTVVERVQTVPFGKGMAGLAAQRREPVQVCNLQQDQSGDVRPGAKLTGMEGSIAVPMLVEGEVRGVLGLAKPVVYEFTEAEKETLLGLANVMGRRFR